MRQVIRSKIYCEKISIVNLQPNSNLIMKSILFLVLVASCSVAAKPHQTVAHLTYNDALTKELSCDLCIIAVAIIDKFNPALVIHSVMFGAEMCKLIPDDVLEFKCIDFISNIILIVLSLEGAETPKAICKELNYCADTPKIA